MRVDANEWEEHESMQRECGVMKIHLDSFQSVAFGGDSGSHRSYDSRAQCSHAPMNSFVCRR